MGDPNYDGFDTCENHPLTEFQSQNQNPQLTDQEIASLRAYSSGPTREINTLLRGGNINPWITSSIRDHANVIQRVILRQLPFQKPITLYRSFPKTFKLSEVGETFALQGIVSTSLIRAYGNGSALFGVKGKLDIPAEGMVAVTISIKPNGKLRGFSMNAIPNPEYQGECEVVLTHGAKFKVTKSIPDGYFPRIPSKPLSIQAWEMIENGPSAFN
jgi:hypothetical protein